MKNVLVFVILILVFFCLTNAQTLPRLSTNTNAEVIAAMTLEEKARLLVGMGMNFPGDPPPGLGTFPSMEGDARDKVPGAAGTTAAFRRFGIPALVLADGPAGLRISPTRPNSKNKYFATAFPIASLLASSWDTDLVYRVGEAMGSEAREYGVDILLAPGMNIHRNALGGRNFEYYSEDPLLTGKMASSMVRGVQSKGVGTSIKHFAANNHETNRMTMDVKVGERTLREIYLRGFEIAVREARPWTVMSSYNKVNGTYTSENADLLTTILRQDWGFRGFVMTDWFGGSNPMEQMKAGNNLIMPGLPVQIGAIVGAVKAGQLDEKILDRNVDGMLKIIRSSPAFKEYRPSNKPDLKAHASVARRAASEGMVLLRNYDRTLPFRNIRTIAAFGNHSYGLVSGGTGSGDVNEAYTVSLAEGLENSEYAMNSTVRTAYEKYIADEKAKQPVERSFLMPETLIPERVPGNDEIEASTTSDTGIITIGRTSGEFADRTKDGGFYLTGIEKDLIKRVSEAFHAKNKMVVVVLNTGGVVETASWKKHVDAVLLAWLPGQEAGNAIADVLAGRVNPSGKLPTTFAKHYDDDPTAEGFPGRIIGKEIDYVFIKTFPSEIFYDEGIYVGYRAFDRRNIEPSFEFGFGLSYTRFEYSNLVLSSNVFEDEISATVDVKNTGTERGKEIVQLYVSTPDKMMDKPEKELKGFIKTRLLKPNESQTVTMKLNGRSLASFSESEYCWIAEKGDYKVRIGASSRDIRLKAHFRLDKTITVEAVKR